MSRLTGLVLFGLGCAGPDVCAEPRVASAPDMGDANGDGGVDVSDGLFLGRSLFAGGAAPVCDAAADVLGDGVVDAADGVSIFRSLYAGTFPLAALPAASCPSVRSSAPPEVCAPVALAVSAPARATGAFDASITLTSPGLDVQGWQLSLTATGCSVGAVDLSGTIAAYTTDGGLRREGFAESGTTKEGAWSGVALGWKGDTAAPASADAVKLLTVHMSASPPTSGCAPCVLTLADGQSAPGGSLRNVVSSGGRSYRPTLGSATVDVCGG